MSFIKKHWSEEQSTITLGPRDAALVLRDDGEGDVYMPTAQAMGGYNSDVPGHCALIGACLLAVGRERTRHIILKWLADDMQRMRDEEEREAKA